MQTHTSRLLVSLALTLVTAPLPAAQKGIALRLQRLPPAVQQTIRAQAGAGRVDDFTRTNENGEVVFEVDLHVAGVDRAITVAMTGKLLARQVFLDELAMPVQRTIRARLGTAKLVDIFWTDEDGEISYEIEMMRGESKRSFSVAPDGRLMSFQVELLETPAAVQKAVQAQLGKGGQLLEIHHAEEDGEPLYVVETNKDGRKHNFSVGPDGELLSVSVELGDAPAAVQKTIKTQAGTGRVVEIDRWEDDSEIFFETKVSRDGRRLSFIVAADGKLMSTRVTLAQTPTAVQTAIKAQLAGATLLHVDKTTDAEALYEVEARRNGKSFSFTVGADGAVRGGN